MTDPRNSVSDVMTHDAVSVDEKLTLRSLAAVLADADIGVALVRRPDGAVSIVSERDVVRALADGADAEEVWAADIVSDDIAFTRSDETILDVAEHMAAEEVRHLPVMDDGAIVGVVSARDVLPVLTTFARSTM